MSDGNLAVERGQDVAHSFNCPSPRIAGICLADALVYSLRYLVTFPAQRVNFSFRLSQRPDVSQCILKSRL